MTKKRLLPNCTYVEVLRQFGLKLLNYWDRSISEMTAYICHV